MRGKREGEKEFVHVSLREMLSNKAINFTCKKNYLSRKRKGNEKISALKATNTRQSMCSFIITPSILFRMQHTEGVCARPGGNNQVKHGFWIWVMLPGVRLLYGQNNRCTEEEKKQWENKCRGVTLKV